MKNETIPLVESFEVKMTNLNSIIVAIARNKRPDDQSKVNFHFWVFYELARFVVFDFA
ncbi:hypothetical protein HanPSC8_Chr01g0020261 [Helianthus annuus]|nr:hypothetical protein HanPSC8_Chr01g0020261 [Helianthus annuus]